MSDYLPEEVILEILCKLPIKSILQCTSVCRSWNSLIKSPAFISKHLTLSTKHQPFFLLHYFSEQGEEHYSLNLENQDFYERMQLHFPFLRKKESQDFHFVGSCNGLICFANKSERYKITFILWNPLVRKYLNVILETDFFSSPFVGFGYDSHTHDYKLVWIDHGDAEVCSSHRGMLEMKLFSLNKGSWRSIRKKVHRYGPHQLVSVFKDFPLNCFSVFVNGAFHWIAFRFPDEMHSEIFTVILRFDMSDDVLSEIALPDSLAHVEVGSTFLYVLGYKESSIAVCEMCLDPSAEFRLWVMKEYGVVESWTNVFTVADTEVRHLPSVLGFKEEEEILLEMHDRHIVSYNLKSQQTKDLGIKVEKCQTGNTFVGSFVESLVLLDRANGTSCRNRSNNFDAIRTTSNLKWDNE